MSEINISKDGDFLNKTEHLAEKAEIDNLEKEHRFPVRVDLIGPEWGARPQCLAMDGQG